MSKLNSLLQAIPKNGVVLDSWLKKMGIYTSLKQKYLASGWLSPLGRGASYRTRDVPTWEHALVALQQQGGFNIHVGGKTSLELQGAAHFIKEKLQDLYLYGGSTQRLPQWFKQHDWQIVVHYLQGQFLVNDFGIMNLSLDKENYLKVSTIERSLLELLHLVPNHYSIEDAYYIVENLNDIDYKSLQNLLENCNSIKVKRLCLYLSERAEHQWVGLLDKSKIDLGSGNRQIVTGGFLDTVYHITVPKNWKKNEQSIF